MDSEPTDEQTGVEDELKKSVEIVVETDAEVGASGYSVTGGGERGIFVKDVLKDSPAAKHLSLQQGDQLLSAKVYFENVRYEDALKILQCAEPYKVSFQLKRTVPETEVSVRPRVPGGEVKGPKAKVAKMSVKGTKLFKTQKRRGGRFGLKRLKEKNREELVIEGTPPRLEAGDVDVEFSLPKFKQRKGVQEAEPAAGKGKKRIRFPHMKTKSYTGAVTGGKLGTGQLEVDENIYPPETSRAGIKTKGKGHKFGIAFPKSKHNKSGSDSQTGSLERKPPEVRIHPPSVEFDVSSDKDVEKRGLKFKTPDVEFALPSGKAEASVSTVEDTSGSKAPKGDFRGEAEVAGGKVHADVSKGDAKLRMPKLKLPKVRLSRHSDEIDSAFKVKTPKAEIKGDGELQLPEGNIRMPKVEGDLSGGAASVQIPSVDISLPKGKGKFDAGVSLPESGVKAGVNMPDIEVAGSDIDLELTTGQKIPDEVESMVKGPKISMPKVDISLPKAGSAGVEGPDVGGKFSLPSVDISLPQMNSGGGDVDMDCYVGGDGKFKMPEFDPAFPNVKSLDGEGTFKLPKVDLSLPKGKAGTSDDDRAAFQLPSMEVSLPNMKGDKVEVNTKGGKLKMPEVEISPPKGHLQGGFEVEGKAGKKSKKGKKLKMPTVDVSMPKLTQPEGHIEGPEMTSGGGIQLPSHDASLPTAKMKGNIEIEGPSAKGGRFTMPSVNVKLPQMGSSEAGVDLHERKTGVVSGDVSLKPMGDIEGKVEGEKFTLPSVDVSLPKMKLPKGDVTLEGPDLNLSLPSSDGKASGESGGGKFKMPSCDISLQKGKVKEGEVNIRGPEAKGGKFQMPSFDVSLPQMKKRGGDVDVELPKLKGGDIKAPTIEISGLQGTFEGDYDLDSYRKEGGYSLPGMKFPEGEGNFQGPKVKGAKFEMPKIDLSLPRGRKQGGDFDVEVYSRKDGSIEMPSCDFDGPKGELSTDINVDGLEGKTGKFKMPKIDISLPKLNLPEGEIHIEGPEIKGQMEKPSLDITPPEGKLDVDIDSHKTKGSKFHMPTINVNLPKIKSKEVSIDVKGPEGPEGKLPSCDITVPDKKFPKADVSLEGPNVKGGHVSMPGVEVSLPKTKGNVGISVDTPEGNGEKLQMPKFDISLPKVNFPESAGKTKKIDLKTKKMEMPDIDVSLPKGKAEADIEIDGGKGRKFHIPSVDFSLPRIKTKGSEIKTEGVEGKVHVPDTDVSLSKGKVEVNTNVEGGEVKGGKFKMPKFDISFPNMNLPEGKPEVDVSITKGKIKENVDLGGKFPTVEISPPKIQARDIDVGITTPEGANLDISLPKASLPGGDIKVEGPNIKGPKIEMPDIDLSLPKGKGRGDIEITGGSHKGGKFHMPAIDITLPKMKTKGADVHVEGPEVKGSQIKIPSLDVSGPKLKSPDVDVSLKGPEIEGQFKKPKGDISLPKGEVQGDFEVEGPDMKGGKFKMPKFDVSLPKVSLPKFDANIGGPDVKGKVEMPNVDISVPEATTDLGVDVGTGKGSKFHMPSLDISLPKMKTKGPNINLEGPEVRGDMSLPEIKSPDLDINLQGPTVKGGNLSLPTVDVAFPKTEGDFEVEGPDMKGGKFKMPKFDVSLPKVSLPKFDANIEGPDVKGKAQMPSVDISVPKATADVGVDVDTGKGTKFHMPSFDISLPKMKTKGPNINLEGPEVRGDMSLPKITSPEADINLQGPTVEGGNLSLPTVDVAFPTTEGDFEVEGPDMKGGKFKMPKFDVSLPKVSLPKFDVNIEGPDVKGKAQMPSVDISVPKATTDVGVDVDTGKGSKFHMPSFDISLPKIKAKGPNINLEGPEVRGDMSLPKVKSPDLDVNLQGPEVERGDMSMPTLDVSLSKPEGEFEVQGPEVKGGKIKMPKFPKVGLPEVDVKLKGPDINVGKIEMPDIDISLPKGKVKGDAELEAHTGKRGKFHMPAIDISLPKIKTKEPEINIKGPEVKGGKIPDIDLSLPRGEVDADLSFDGPEKKGGHLKMPKVNVSLPQIKLAGDVTVEGPEMKGKTNEPAVGFSKGDGKMEGDLKKGLGLHMPNIDLHLPKLDFDLSLPSGSRGQGLKVETGGSDASADVHIPGTKGQLKPPKVKATDASINTGSEDTPGASLKLPTVKLPTVDISAPKVDLDFGLTKSKSDDVEVELLKAEGGRPSSGGSFDLPDVSLKVPGFNFPRFGGKSKSSELQISKPEVSISPPDVEGELRAPSVEFDDEGKVKVKKPKIKMPTFGISRKNPDVSVSCPEVDVKAKKEYVDIPTPNINVEGSDDRTKYKVKLPKFKISSPKPKLPEKEGDVKVEADGKGGFHAPDVTIKLPKFSMPGFGSKEKDLGKPVGEVEAKTKLKMPSVELSLPETKTPDTEVLLPKAEVDVSEADIKGYEGNLKVPKMPKIDISIPKVDLDVSLPKGKSQKIEKPDTEVKGEGKFKIPQITMPSLDVSIPKGKSGDYDSPDVEVDVDRGKFNMPYVKMPSVDITFPKPKTGKPLDVDVDRDGNKLRMPDIKMPNVNISKENSDKLEGPDVDVQGRGKLKMPNVDINLSRGKKSDVNAPDLETPDVTTEWDTDRRFKMPSVDISLPKGKLKGNNPPDIEMGVQGEGKVKLPHVKMPDFDVSFPKRRSKDPQMEIKEKDGNLKTPNVSTPSVDFSLSTGKDVDVEESSGGKFKLPHWKMPDVDISLPKGHVEGPEEELTREKGGLKMPHISLPSVDISLPKGRADGPNVERGDGEEKFSSPYTKMPSVDISVTKGKSVDPNVELKGEGGTKFQMPHVKMPNVEFSLPKGKDVSKFEPEGEKEKLKMPSVDISMPTGKIHGPKAEVEGGKLQGPHIKMPHVNISLPKGKSDKSEGAKVDYSPEIKGERKKFKMVKEDISLPKGRVLVEGPEVDMKGDASMASAKAEGGNIKLPHMKFPKVDISLPKGRSKGSSSPAMEMSVTGPEGELPKVPSSKADIELPSVEAQGKLRVPQGAHLDSSSEGDHDSLKLKIPTIQIKGPKEDLELETGSHKEEGNKVKKSVELPDLDLTLEGSSDIGKGPKTKGGKFKIRKHKKKTGKDASTKPHSEDEVEERVKHNSSKDGKDDIIVQLPGVTPPSVSLKPSTADVRVPRIPDIEFDIGTSQDEDEGRTENKIKIPKFGIPLPSISSPERLAHGPEVQYEGPKIPKVKKAVFVLVNPSEPDASATSPSLQREQTKAGTETEEVTVKMSKKKMKTSFGKSKDKSATESAERKAEEEEKSRGLKMKMPKVKFSPAKSGSSGVKGDKEDKDASPHKDDKGTFGGKLKLPKVELTSPYGKMAAGEENKGARLEKEADRGLPAPAESAGDVVSSQARTEMLDRDSSESPEGFNMEFSSAKVQMWSDSKGTEERESSSWFKVPKVTLKPLSSGFLQITPEGSPQAQRKGEVAGVEDVSGSFCIHSSELDFTAQQMSEERHVSASEEGTVTTVTKATRITRQLVTSQTRTAESSTTTTRQVSDFNF